MTDEERRERERARCRLYGKTRRKPRDQRKPGAMSRQEASRLGGLARVRNLRVKAELTGTLPRYFDAKAKNEET